MSFSVFLAELKFPEVCNAL